MINSLLSVYRTVRTKAIQSLKFYQKNTPLKRGGSLIPYSVIHNQSVQFWNRKNYDAIADEIFRLREQKEQAEANSLAQQEKLDRINELQAFIKNQSTFIPSFDESLVRKIIESITVFPDHFTVKLKSDITIDITA